MPTLFQNIGATPTKIIYRATNTTVINAGNNGVNNGVIAISFTIPISWDNTPIFVEFACNNVLYSYTDNNTSGANGRFGISRRDFTNINNQNITEYDKYNDRLTNKTSAGDQVRKSVYVNVYDPTPGTGTFCGYQVTALLSPATNQPVGLRIPAYSAVLTMTAWK